MDHTERLKLADELTQSGVMEGSECGEYWIDLASLARNHWQMNDDFKSAFDSELKSTVNYLHEHFEIVEQTVQRPTVVKTLEMKDTTLYPD